ncbi:metalloregulator ArsR/SmtB family transcription factor [Psychromarinibacter sp. C21-152]|uniref:Metalloregulator ArsR/SmtB family transcription factor n=1 Tax=Psychromarinibacter sediminicola TaxID=3033385 RepID=A0AAE3NPC5_9RHOB|nr:metalloregulator ArsR/SmtB family transcription factor [Psychromarinibacter sediminicola]MDF0599189.1 metalloregulator ArsR/SmtB family transcription factor [Psychromarinibacter sediminicola]
MTDPIPQPDAAFAALADPTRRALIDRLRAGPLPVGRLAADLPISRPAVSQHLRVLSDAGLLEVEPQGTRRLYRLAPDRLRELRAWLDGLWGDAMDSFAARAREIAQESPK